MDVKELATQMNQTWAEMKSVLGTADAERKKHGEVLADTTAKLNQIEAKLAELGDVEAKLNARVDAVEISGKRAPVGGAESKAAKAAMNTFLRKGAEALQPEERKFMAVSDDTSGGYLAETEFIQEIIKDVVDINPLRSLVRMRNTSQRSVKIRKRTGVPTAVWTGAERVTKTGTTEPKYGMFEIPNHEIYALVDVSNQDLEDSAFDLEGELRADVAEQFAVAEGLAFLSGSGLGQPEGLLTNSGVLSDNSGSASAITYDGLVYVSHNIKDVYAQNGRFLFNRKTLGAIRRIKDSAQMPVWAPMTADAPSNILGSPYTVVPGMDDEGSNKYPVAFGDLRRAYLGVDRVAISILRDPITQATEGAVRFLFRKRIGGAVVQAEAIRKLKCST